MPFYAPRRSVPAIAILCALPLQAATLAVGPGKAFSRPCAAIAAAAAGDTIEIDARGEYKGDVCTWSTDRLTLRGINGRAKIDAAGRASQAKAIWVIRGSDTVVENLEFTGAAVPDKNGAGIRQEGRNLTVRHCYFHHNEDGILAGDSPESEILIEYSEFAYNGAGDGYSHNMYINHVARFTLQFCYSHHSKVGHLVKTRAAENYILYNRLSDEADGTGSYEINVPNGGKTFIIGNVIEQGPQTSNSTIMTYCDEGPNPANPSTILFIVNNTFANDRPGAATFISIPASDPTPAVIRNNIFYGPGIVTNQASASLAGNVSTLDSIFVDAAKYDYHLRRILPAVGAVREPADKMPKYQYVHPASGEPRRPKDPPGAGAYEFGQLPIRGQGTQSDLSQHILKVSLLRTREM